MNPRNFFDTSDVKFLKSRKIWEQISFLVLIYFPLTTNQLSAASAGGTSKTCPTLRDRVAIRGAIWDL